jgi:hypothetical protein
LKFNVLIISLVVLSGFIPNKVLAQDLEPRFLSDMPTGGNFLVASYGYSTGNILVDNTLPIDNLNANINSVILGYAKSFSLFNKLAKVDVIAPYSFASYTGSVSSIDTSRIDNGFGDPMVRISIVLIGAPAYTPKEFIKNERRRFKLGVLLRIRAPLGKYNGEKLLNLGANRWGTKIGIASSYIITKKIIVEGHLNTWLFTANTNFFNGNTIKQAPILSAQVHITYIFKPGFWFAFSVGKSGYGRTSVNSVEQSQNQNNSRYGMALAYRVGKHNAIKVAYTSGVSTRYGADFNSVILAYQFMWFDKP